MSVPLHQRSVQVDCHLDERGVRVVGRLTDRRPWYEGNPRAVLHDMELELVVDLETMTIVDAQARMLVFPHDECPLILERFKMLVGLSITRGFTRALNESFSGVSGCQHLHELARAMGPVVFQARSSSRAIRRVEGDPSTATDPNTIRRTLAGTCHIWDTDGVGEQKLGIGWMPGFGGYPAPSVERLRAGES